MTGNFDGQVVVVTGATRGIGKAIAVQFKDRGAAVIGTGKSRLTKCPVWLDDYIRVDFNRPALVEKFCHECIARFDRLDVLVQNAGINVNDPIWNVAPTNLMNIIYVNLLAPFHIAKATAQLMQHQNGGGRIVFIGSIWAETGKTRRSVYSATKAGLAGLTRSMAADLAPHGVLVNMVSPGFTKTQLTDQTLTTHEQKEFSLEVPLRRFAEPAEIARLVLWLSSWENTYITGQNIHIDGGFHNVRV